MAGLELTEFQVLGLKVCAVTPGTKLSINRLNSPRSYKTRQRDGWVNGNNRSLKFEDGTQEWGTYFFLGPLERQRSSVRGRIIFPEAGEIIHSVKC